MTAKEIVEEVRRLAEDPDKKRWARDEEMRCLIAAGAKVIKNGKTEGNKYVTEVIYEGIHFTHASHNPLIPTNSIFH